MTEDLTIVKPKSTMYGIMYTYGYRRTEQPDPTWGDIVPEDDAVWCWLTDDETGLAIFPDKDQAIEVLHEEDWIECGKVVEVTIEVVE